MRVCRKCSKEKPLDKFTKHKTSKYGRSHVCRECSNQYNRKYKLENKERLGKLRRKRYRETEGRAHKDREDKRKREYPLRYRCQVLRSGMVTRSRQKNLVFDKEFFTVDYLMQRLTSNTNCECCSKKLDISFKNDKKFNDNSPSMDRVNSRRGYLKDNVAIICWRCNKHKQGASAKELRMIADYIDSWGNEVGKFKR